MSKKTVISIIGYFIFGTIWIFINNISMIPLGMLFGFARIYQRIRKGESFQWKYLVFALAIGALLGSGFVPGIYINIFNISINI